MLTSFLIIRKLTKVIISQTYLLTTIRLIFDFSAVRDCLANFRWFEEKKPAWELDTEKRKGKQRTVERESGEG